MATDVMKSSEDVYRIQEIHHNRAMRVPSEIAVRSATDIFRAQGGILRTRDAVKAGIHYSTLYWMRDSSLLETLGRGLYRLAELPGLTDQDMLTVAARVPDAVICLISALAFHHIGTQIPHRVSIALPPKAWAPRADSPPLRVYRMSGPALVQGVEEHVVDGQRVRVFSVAKTVADCFKYRNKVGLDVAVEALQEALRSKKTTPAEIMQCAEADRVTRVIQPYLEALQPSRLISLRL